jgi:uncharacterized protein with PQ loop repeat
VIEALGWLGSFFLAVCAFPQAWMSWKQGHSNGLSSGLLWLWGGGEVLTLVYVLALGDAPLIFNYACNMASMAVIIWYKVRPRETLADSEFRSSSK